MSSLLARRPIDCAALGTVVEDMQIAANTELEVAIAHHTTQYKISPCPNSNGTATNYIKRASERYL